MQRWNARSTAAGKQQCEMMRDEVANDNMGTAERAQMMAWAQDRMHQPAWRQMAVRAMWVAQSGAR